MARVVRVMGPRVTLPEPEQRTRATAVVKRVRQLLAEGDRAGANEAILHGVHEGIDAVVMFEAIDA